MQINRKFLYGSLVFMLSSVIAAPVWADGVFADQTKAGNTNAVTGTVAAGEQANSTFDGTGIITAADGNGTLGTGVYMVNPGDTLRVPLGATFNNSGTNGGGSLEVNGTMEVNGVLNNTAGIMTVNITNGGRLLFALGAEYQGPGILNTIDGTLIQAPADMVGLGLLWTDIMGTQDKGDFAIVPGGIPVVLPATVVVPGDAFATLKIQGSLAPANLVTVNSINAGASALEVSNVKLNAAPTFGSTTNIKLSGTLQAPVAPLPVMTIAAPASPIDVNGLVVELASCPTRAATITVINFSANVPTLPTVVPLVKCTEANGDIWTAPIEVVLAADLGKVQASNWQRISAATPQSIPVNNPWFLAVLGLLCAFVVAKTPRFLQRKL